MHYLKRYNDLKVKENKCQEEQQHRRRRQQQRQRHRERPVFSTWKILVTKKAVPSRDV